jgi:hypothetical protein
MCNFKMSTFPLNFVSLVRFQQNLLNKFIYLFCTVITWVSVVVKVLRY